MTSNKYEDIHWISLDTVRQYLFTRIGTPLQCAIEQASVSQNATIKHLKTAQNTLDAWTALVRWKRDAASIEEEYKDIDLHQMPAWLTAHFEQQCPIKFEQERAVRVHPPVFYEGLQLLATLAQSAGKLAHIMVSDASTPREGVWIRFVFTPAASTNYQSKLTIMDKMTERFGQTIPLQFALIADLLEINETRFSLQNNTRTGHQALAVLAPEAKSMIEVKATPEPAPAAASTTKAAEAPAPIKTPSAPTPTVTPPVETPVATNKAPETKAETTPTTSTEEKKTTQPASAPDASDNLEAFIDEQPTNPLPAVVLYEKAEEIDQTDDLLARVQDVLLDYIGTKDILSRANEIVAKIYAMLKAETAKDSDSVVDKDRLEQLYAIMKIKPSTTEPTTDTANPPTDHAGDILAALQGLLMEPLTNNGNQSTNGGDISESVDDVLANVEAASDEPRKDPSVQQSAESSGIT